MHAEVEAVTTEDRVVQGSQAAWADHHTPIAVFRTRQQSVAKVEDYAQDQHRRVRMTEMYRS